MSHRGFPQNLRIQLMLRTIYVPYTIPKCLSCQLQAGGLPSVFRSCLPALIPPVHGGVSDEISYLLSPQHAVELVPGETFRFRPTRAGVSSILFRRRVFLRKGPFMKTRLARFQDFLRSAARPSIQFLRKRRPPHVTCPVCQGSGTCRSCRGLGTMGLMGPPCLDCGGGRSQSVAAGAGHTPPTQTGTGRCHNCHGRGTVPERPPE